MNKQLYINLIEEFEDKVSREVYIILMMLVDSVYDNDKFISVNKEALEKEYIRGFNKGYETCAKDYDL